MTQTTIRCLTCTSTVPWGPHCPECGAYLEFAGDPPWRPTPEGIEPSPEAPAATVVDLDTTPQAEVMVTEETVRDVVEVRTSTVPAPVSAPAATSTRSGTYAGTIGALAAGLVLVPILWWAVGGVIGVASAVVFVVWALVLLPRRQPTVTEQPVPSVETVEAVTVTVTETLTAPAEPLLVEARAPQTLDRRTVETTRPLITRTVEGDTPCSRCSRMNTRERAYCTWCGAPMADALLAPTTKAVEPSAPVAPEEQKRRQRAGLSRSWRTPILVLTLAGVLVSSILFALFGPGAFQFRFGLTNIYQLINTFIDPYAGSQAVVEDVVATSNTRGTSPRDILGPDATTFWASVPSEAQGAGEQLAFWFDDTYTINRMAILPGIQNGVFDTRAVASPKDITLTFDDGTSVQAKLDLVQTESDLQQLVRFPKVTTETVRLRIDSVYPPRTPSTNILSEVAISGVRFLTPPAPPEFIRLPNDIQPRDSLPGTTS
jgi:hypothetical protein